MNLLFSTMMTLSFLLTWLKHPLSMGLILILQTMMTALISGYMLTSFFFSYIITMIMLSGALVLFIYMASIASNEKFKSSYMLLWMSLAFLLLCYIYMYNYNMNYYINNVEYNETISLIKLFNTTTAQMTMMMIFYLFITMIVVSNIAKVNDGPLRMKTN
uniref:NADH dehydrogenase subunit 6 n=1 Tax=Erthesina fullo TaxID=299276 RepID=A0A4D5XMH2_9HEMI|nr:NADH dehydrogenase subunit 6 [Erthesina fullo]QBR54803.1 NADH dehydrogenase subunit 6 [Erthesina fullo]UAJ48737.1 NADH dehydrogenase subunit 6 [Erthesina fullo]